MHSYICTYVHTYICTWICKHTLVQSVNNGSLRSFTTTQITFWASRYYTCAFFNYYCMGFQCNYSLVQQYLFNCSAAIPHSYYGDKTIKHSNLVCKLDRTAIGSGDSASRCRSAYLIMSAFNPASHWHWCRLSFRNLWSIWSKLLGWGGVGILLNIIKQSSLVLAFS